MISKLHVFGIVFSAVYSLAYVIAVEQNYALVTYHPAIGEFGWFTEPPRDGPAMYWYGWIATAGIIATFAGMISSLLPGQVAQRLWPNTAWCVPVAVMLLFGYLLRGFFTG